MIKLYRKFNQFIKAWQLGYDTGKRIYTAYITRDEKEADKLEAIINQTLGQHGIYTCSKYNEPVLPDENGNCSLCGALLVI